MIKLVTFKWVTFKNESNDKIDSEGQEEFEFEIDNKRLLMILTFNNYFDGYYTSLEDFIDRYEMEHTVYIYNNKNLQWT